MESKSVSENNLSQFQTKNFKYLSIKNNPHAKYDEFSRPNSNRVLILLGENYQAENPVFELNKTGKKKFQKKIKELILEEKERRSKYIEAIKQSQTWNASEENINLCIINY